MTSSTPLAWFGGQLATDLQDLTSDLAALESEGWWAVLRTFEGTTMCARFRHVRRAPLPPGRWQGPDPASWVSTLDREAYMAAVQNVRARIARGEVYQANICRILSAPLPDLHQADVATLTQRLLAGNPAPFGGCMRLPDHDIHIASASPELYLGRSGSRVRSRPIKGTTRPGTPFLDKDRAENVMIVDLVRNDLSRFAGPGGVEVAELCAREAHPGLDHLVSTVEARIPPEVSWSQMLEATFPPGSVTGAPKSTAVRAIAELEPSPRGPYCGALGWVDADAGTASLSVAIRTFWVAERQVHFGTGAGITWASDPEQEWGETQLKSAGLVALASGTGPGSSL